MTKNFIEEVSRDTYFSYFYGNFEPVSSISTFLSKKLKEAKIKVGYKVSGGLIMIDYPNPFFNFRKNCYHDLYQDWVLEWIENNNK